VESRLEWSKSFVCSFEIDTLCKDHPTFEFLSLFEMNLDILVIRGWGFKSSPAFQWYIGLILL